jgi:hypothetical protein
VKGGDFTKKTIIVLCFLFGMAILWMSRFTVYPSGGGRDATCYKLDRFTGKVTYIKMGTEFDIDKFRATESLPKKQFPGETPPAERPSLPYK